jgi:orotidine-5'-phosphate decarboxylase
MPNWFHSADPLFEYCRIVIDAVHDLVPIVKPQSAYFEADGSRGVEALERVMAYARSRGLLVLLDAKRGDIGATSEAYAAAYLSEGSKLRADALTVNPYLGPETLTPFVDSAIQNGAGLFVLAVTSNPGSAAIQKLVSDGMPVYEHVARMVSTLNPPKGDYGPIGVVAGATYPAEAARLRQLLPRSIFLVPGIGAQGGDIETLRPLFDSRGLGAIVNNARAIMYPAAESHDEKSLAPAIRDAAAKFVSDVNAVRS